MPVRLPVEFRSTCALASENPIRYCFAIPRLLPQAPPPAVALGWFVLKNVVPESVPALPTFFSPAANVSLKPQLLLPLVLVASNRAASVMVPPAVAVDVQSAGELNTPLELLRSLII